MPPPYIQQLAGELGCLMAAYVGRDGRDGESPTYLPFSVLGKFWKGHMITRALNAYPTLIAERPDTIREHFLLVFSLLVYLCRLKYINQFTQYSLRDSSFPLEEFPRVWPETPTYRELFDKIKQEQWKFFPLIFDQNKLFGQTLSPRHILPICSGKVIREGTSVTVYKIKVNADCTNMDQKTFVVKSYKHQYREYYERERRAFTSLETYSSQHIVKFYGSFIQKRDPSTPTYNLILEYVDGGNLEELFATTGPPQTLSDTIQFWGAFVGLFEALFHFHLSKTNLSNHIQGIHQDIKPENILVSKTPSGGPFDFILKLTDFGLSHTKMLEHDAEDPTGVDSHGGQTYGAPECSHHARYTERGKQPITTEADIFSMGCVMSDAAAWVFKGEKGRKDYTAARITEMNTLPTFRGSGHEGCFHNGITALNAVVETHDIVSSSRSAQNFDSVTPKILQVVQHHMLVRRDNRWAAKELRECFAKITQGTRDSIDSLQARPEHPKTLPSTEDETHSPSENILALSLPTTNNIPSKSYPPSRQSLSIRTTRRSFLNKNDANGIHTEPAIFHNIASSPQPLPPSQARQLPMFFLQDAKSYREDKKGGSSISRVVEQAISILKNNLNDRDHMFFIDTSETMCEIFDELTDAFQSFAYIAKQIDTNGVELFFSSNPHKRHAGSTTALRKKFDNQTWDGMIFEDKFGKFIDKTIIPRLHSKKAILSSKFTPKSLNIFVFTDARWGIGKEKAAGVENPVIRIIEEIRKRKLNRTHVVIQFIRFGDDIDGQRYLAYLDELGKDYNCDMVDTKPVTGNLSEMFIGAIDPHTDEIGEGRARIDHL